MIAVNLTSVFFCLEYELKQMDDALVGGEDALEAAGGGARQTS